MRFLSKKDVKLPSRKADSHKGDNGVVLAVGGSAEYPGAIGLASLAALRSGADLVRVAAPEKVAWVLNTYSADVITIKLPGSTITTRHVPYIEKYLKSSCVLLLGNGIGRGKEAVEVCKKLAAIPMQKVIDADALRAVSLQNISNAILTPHIRELETLLLNSKIKGSIVKKIINEKNSARKSSLIQKTAKKWLEKNNIILLKGKIDCIITKNNMYYNKTGNPGMTRGGTGDVLAGLCAGFLAQSWDVEQSAINAAYINGMVGDILLKKKRGYFFLASDMIQEIKRIRKGF
jgi:NAD(P)H-hydrate epimerase